MSKNKKNKKRPLDDTMLLESHDTAADEMPCQEAKKVVGQQGKKNTFGRKV